MHDYYGRHHHCTTALAALAGQGAPLTLMPEASLTSEDHVAIGICLSGPTPHLRLVSDHDTVTIELAPRDLERIFDEVAKVNARPQVELRVVEAGAPA